MTDRMAEVHVVTDRPLSGRQWLSRQLEPAGTLLKLVKYIFLFWSACLVAAVGTGYGLIHFGMSTQSAFYSALTVALLPVVALGILAGIYWWLSLMQD